MKTIGKILALCILLAMAVGLCVSAAAADRTYTVRIYAGNQGTLTVGDGNVWIQQLQYGDTVSFNPSMVELPEDSRYYVRGIREAGLDNDAIGYSSFRVTRDIDYVVAYGILSTAVQYTVNYLSEDGTALAPSQVFYGNVGDRPVVAFAYVEGYQPQAYNLTKTLTENPGENVFSFTYREVESGTIVVPPSPTPSGAPEENPETTEAPENGETPETTEAPENGETPENGTEPENTGNESGTGNEGGEQGQGTEGNNGEPEEIIDLDDVPAAAPGGEDGQTEKSDSGFLDTLREVPGWAYGAGGGVIAAAVAIPIIVSAARRKKNR